MAMNFPDHAFGSQMGTTQMDYNYPSQVQTIEDIEHPAWISSSFSESCGSCLSRISSLCLDNKGTDSPDSPESRYDHHQDAGETLAKEGTESLLQQEEENEPNDPFVMSGSLQSLSSSSKTIYASPRSNSENLLCYAQNRLLKGKTVNRQGSLYRKRAPSENALDFTNLNLVKASKLSHSLHDVSSIPSNGLKNPIRNSHNNRASLSALHMRNRSRDSGFIRADSLQSLSSGSRNYDHVESKVKQYIQGIKDADAERKRERALSNDIVSDLSKPIQNQFTNCNGPEFIHIVQRMKNDLEQKDQILLKLQEDYNNLLRKYAEAENKMDKMRFGWCENAPPDTQENATLKSKGQPLISCVSQQSLETSALGDIENCSLNSSCVFSNFEHADFCNTSIFPRNDFMERNKKDVVISAPLRPISSLYCTSARLDKVVIPLISKSSVAASSITSSGGPSNTPLNGKDKKHVNAGLPDVTIMEGTTDTGIESCCPLSGEGFSATCLPLKSGPVGHLPHEDPMLKVQRWQKSLPVSCHADSQYPHHFKRKLETPVVRTNGHVKHKSITDGSKVEVSSVGIQVNEALEFPSLSSELSTPIVPCLNLGELSSGCTDELSGSVPISELRRLTSITDSNLDFHMNSSSVQEPHNSAPSKSLETSSLARHMCEGLCRVCGRSIIQEKKKRGYKLVSPMISCEVAKLSSLVGQEQDHVVPASPDDEKSYQLAFRVLKKLSSLESSQNSQAILSLLDILQEKVLLGKCSFHDNSVKVDATVQVTSPPEPPPEYSDDGSLLQCLEELDEYTHQVWEKTESFLKVLNSKNQPSSMEPQ